MWVKPTEPASPCTPVTVEGAAGDANNDEATGVAATLVAAATELACSRLAASKSKEVEGEEGKENERVKGEAVKGRRERKTEGFATHGTVSAPPTATGGGMDGQVRDTGGSEGKGGEKHQESLWGGGRHIQHQSSLDNVGRKGGLGQENVGGKQSHRVAIVRSEPHVETHLAIAEPSEQEVLCVGDNTSTPETVDRRKRDPSDHRVCPRLSSQPVGTGGGGSWALLGNGDTSTQPRLGSLAHDGPSLSHANAVSSSTSTSTRNRDTSSLIHPENKSAQDLAHTVAAHAIGTALTAKSPDSEAQDNKCITTRSSTERPEGNAVSARGRPKQCSPGRQHYSETDDNNESDYIVDLSADSDYASPPPPAIVTGPGELTVAPASPSAIVHSDVVGERPEGGDANNESEVIPEGGGHPLSLEETENAMAALLATLRPEPTASSVGEFPQSSTIAPIDGGSSSRESRAPPRHSSPSFPLSLGDADNETSPLPPRLYPRKRLQPLDNPNASCSLEETSSPPVARHHGIAQTRLEGSEDGDAQCHTKGTEVGRAVDEETRHRLQETENAADGGAVVYSGGVVWEKGLDIDVSLGFRGGNSGGRDNGEGAASEAATGVYEDDFDDD